MDKKELQSIWEYAVDIRRQLHRYPEIGFALDNTVKLIAGELEKLQIPYTLKYGQGSVVAELGQGEKLIALRADMDALPVEEKADVPFRSTIHGAMHACGHDAHTGIVLAVARYLKDHEKELKNRVRFIFQPSEEGQISGAKMMVDNGVMDGVSFVLGSHCENTLQSGLLGAHVGDYQAACIPATIRFYGKSTHATLPDAGVDAVAMAVDAYCEMKEMVKKEAGTDRYIWQVGHFAGGEVHNVVADLCTMDISFRFYNMDFAQRVRENVYEICNRIAREYGGKVDILFDMSTGPVCNDAGVVETFTKAANAQGLQVVDQPSRMSSEDFGWYLTKVPGLMFRFGTRNEALGCTATAHRSDFKIDEQGMMSAITAFIAYAMEA
jgi:amidohydrolase